MPTIPPGTAVIDMREAAQRVRNAWASLQGRRFGPGTPLQPSPNTEEQTEGPRQFQYPVGINTVITPRREQPGLLTPFEQLRHLASLYDVAAMCIAVRIEELQGMPWSAVARNKKLQNSLQGEADAVAAFFAHPDKLNDFSAWIGMILYELFSIDALTLYKHPDRAGRLHSLEVVDGSTIKPLLDERGRTVEYQQILHGAPASQYHRPEADAPDEKLPTFAPHELVYRPRWTRSFTPYGFPPTEWVILRINTALRKQSFDLAYFTDGNIPDMIGSPPDDRTLNPQQVSEFETWFNAVLEGDDAARRKVRFVPWNMNLKELRPFSYETALDEWMLKITCSAFGVPPQELGFTNDVNKATAELQEAVNDRRGLRPLTMWLKQMLDRFIQSDLAESWQPRQIISLPGQATRPAQNPFKLLEWQWQFGDDEDRLTQAQTDQIYLSAGVVSPNEIRAMRFGDTLDGAAPEMPLTPALSQGERGRLGEPGVSPAQKFFREYP